MPSTSTTSGLTRWSAPKKKAAGFTGPKVPPPPKWVAPKVPTYNVAPVLDPVTGAEMRRERIYADEDYATAVAKHTKETNRTAEDYKLQRAEVRDAGERAHINAGAALGGSGLARSAGVAYGVLKNLRDQQLKSFAEVDRGNTDRLALLNEMKAEAARRHKRAQEEIAVNTARNSFNIADMIRGLR